MKYFLHKFIFLVLFGVFSAGAVEAATFSFEPIGQTAVGVSFLVDLNLNSEDQNINAVSGVITFSTDILNLKEVRLGDTIINFWVEKPSVTEKIVFSGITPGGYTGVKGKILRLVFEGKKIGIPVLKISDSQALISDGKGTSAKISLIPTNISIVSAVAPISSFEISDQVLPEEFVPEVIRDRNLFDNQWSIIFSTQDKGSGVNHYEIQENSSRKIDPELWTKTDSPYVLSDQTLKKYIFVKAVDNKNNERIVIVSPPAGIPWYENYLIWSIILLAVGFLGGVLWYRRKK